VDHISFPLREKKRIRGTQITKEKEKGKKREEKVTISMMVNYNKVGGCVREMRKRGQI